jgi:hypothetical protein
MAARANARGVTREDLTTAIGGLRELVDSKLDRVLDKVETVKTGIAAHAEAFTLLTSEVKTELRSEVTRIDSVHGKFQKDLDSLKKYRWMLVGAIAVLAFFAEILTHTIFK